MSLIQLQTAAATLVRLPSHYRGEGLEKFVNQFELTEHEEFQLRVLAKDPMVVKYGYSMNTGRLIRIKNLMPLSQFYIDDSELEELWAKQFEPEAATVPAGPYVLAFFNFLLENSKAKSLLEKCPPFMSDILKFEYVRAEFRAGNLSNKQTEGLRAPLAHKGFKVLELDYNIPELFQIFPKEIKADTEIPAPKKERTLTLMVQMGDIPEAKVFEIDDEVSDYLKALLSGASVAPISSFEQLVQLGLCRSA